jgi:hypothetical protein
MAADWPLVGLCTLLLLGSLFAASALYGGIVAMVAATDVGVVIDGITVGAYLAFSAFGVETGAFSPGAPGAYAATQFVPLPWVAMAVAATVLAMRFAFARLDGDRTSVLAFAGKLAVATGILAGILAALLSFGGDGSAAGSFRAEVAGGTAWAYTTVLVGIVALVAVHRRGIPVLPDRVTPQLRGLASIAFEGAKAFALMALGMAAVVLVASLIVLDTGAERLSTLLGTVFMGVTMGVVGAAYALGAAIGLASGHTSLLHFGFPPQADAGAAPVPFFLLLAVAPALVAWTVLSRLDRDQPASEQDATKTGFLVAIGFAATAWVAALLSRVVLGAGVLGGDGASVFLVARPSPAGVIGLGLLWGLVGGLGASYYWARQRGVGWKGAAAGTAPLDDRRCASCGSPVAGGRFCSNCGTPLAGEPT